MHREHPILVYSGRPVWLAEENMSVKRKISTKEQKAKIAKARRRLAVMEEKIRPYLRDRRLVSSCPTGDWKSAKIELVDQASE